ncbi:MAG TPA: hypothetical protein ENK40_06600 [Gammaproteobacteria bacterium]|nr:hypothetical protein [Gammaproteobacteria bacterium]
MNISGVLVHARPERAEAVKLQLQTIPGVEVHAVSPEGRLVVTIEAEHAGHMADTLVACQNVADVLSASMIYHHDESFGDEETDSTAINLSGNPSGQDRKPGNDWNVQEASK